MPKLISLLTLVVLLAITLPVNVMADVALPVGLPPGSQYQVLFVTQGTRDATSSSINDYNAFVTAEAALNPLLPAIGWHAVGRTSSVTAEVNAPSNGLPIFDTNGNQLVPAGVGLYSAVIPSTTILDQFGSPVISYVWTGAIAPGYLDANRGYLGDSQPIGVNMGFSGSCCTFGTGWINQTARQDPTIPLPLYALSDPITVGSPNPADATQALINSVHALGLPNGTEQSLVAKLQAALAGINRKNGPAKQSVVNQLQAFINEVRAQQGVRLTPQQVADLVAAAQQIQASLL